MCRPAALVDVASRGPPLYHPFAPQCGQGSRTTLRHSTPLWAEISCWQWRQFAQCSLSSSRSSAASSRAVDAAGHRGGVVREDRGQALGPAERMVVGGVVDHAILFVRRVVRPLAHPGRGVKAFRGIVEPASWVAEGGLRVRKEGVHAIRGRHRSGCLEMRILPLVTVMIARSSRAWRWLRIRTALRQRDQIDRRYGPESGRRTGSRFLSFGLSSANYSNQHYQEIAFQHHHRYSHRHILRGRLDDVDDDIHREGTRKPPPARR